MSKKDCKADAANARWVKKHSNKDVKSNTHAQNPKFSAREHQLVAKYAAMATSAKILQPKSLRDLSTKMQAASNKGWLFAAADGKSSPELTDELLMLRSALASVYGNKPVPFVFVLSQNASAVSGVLNTVYNMNVNAATEWPSLQALFDEWKPSHGHALFNCQYSVPSAYTQQSACLAMGFDPADAVTATSQRAIAELKQHQLYRPVAEIGPTGTVVSTSFRTKGSEMMRFDYTMKGVDVFIASASGTVEMIDGWRSTTTTGSTANTLIGYVKYYTDVAYPTNGVAWSGIWYHTALFRSRQ